jgi:hypothetical protein
MGFWDIFKGQQPRTSLSHEEDDENVSNPFTINAEKAEIRNQIRQQASIKQKLRLDNMKLESELERIELENRIAEAKLESKIMRKQRLAELREFLGDDDDDDEEDSGDIFETLIKNVIQKTQTPVNNIAPQQVISVTPSISIDEAKKLWAGMSEPQRIAAQAMSDDDIKRFVIHERPNVDGVGIQNVLGVVRGKL